MCAAHMIYPTVRAEKGFRGGHGHVHILAGAQVGIQSQVRVSLAS
jgi:hypothetical protein